MTTDSQENVLKKTLEILIQKSNASFTAEDVLREFRLPKGSNSNRKLLNILKVLCQNKPNSSEYLVEANRVLEKHGPYHCLLRFLENMAGKRSSHGKKKNIPQTSTPVLNTLQSPETANVSDIRERVAQAATGGLSKSAQCSSMSINNSNSHLELSKARSSTSWNFQKIDINAFKRTNIAAVPICSQENALLHDLIYCMTGIRGCHIYPEENPIGDIVNFRISDQINSSMQDIGNQILPLITYYITIQKFIHRMNFSHCGQVLHAFSAALKCLFHDYYLLLTQLETELEKGNLTLHKMLFYVRPTMHTLEVLASVVFDICHRDLRGGPVLTLLCNKIDTLTGDEDSQDFLTELTRISAIPYMDILQLWIQKGIICDPQQEFLVEDNEVISRQELPEHYSADYWEKRYTIRRDRIPSFLVNLSDTILRTGKYLNVIRQCGKEVMPPQTLCLEYCPTNQNHVIGIEAAYRFASKTLLDVLIKENDLMGHLMSVKRYLLLHQGDFITQFMDSCEQELNKNVDKVLPMKLENLLGLTLRLSSARCDPYKDDVHCELLTYDLVTQMTKILNNEEILKYWQAHDRIDLVGLECFAFRYEVKWPISLVLNHIAISKYQMLFRQLFYCKHVERQLCKVWKQNNTAKKFSPHAAEMYRSAFTLRQRMMNAIQNLEYYMMIEVIEPNWHIFIEKMNKVGNVDDVLVVHQDFLDLCLNNCMLTDPTLLRTIIKLCNICLKFCEFIQNAQKHFLDAELSSMLGDSEGEVFDTDTDLSIQKQVESSLAPTDTFSEQVKRYDLEFTGLLLGLLKQINDVASDNPSDRFINLVHRINFNSFYNEQMDKLCAQNSMAPHH